VQVTRPTFLPLLAPADPQRIGDGAVWDEYCGDLTVVYTFGPPFGKRVVNHADLDQMQLSHRVMRRTALEHLESLSGRAQFHGQAPALMLSFDGLESSLLLASEFWARLHTKVPGDLIVGVPARDVVIVTGSQSQPGLEKARRAVDRVFFAGDEHLLTRQLLIRRSGVWEPFERPARAAGRSGQHHGPDQRPRQYQEHPSWPGERVPVAAVRPVGTGNRNPPVERRPGAQPLHVPPPIAPAAPVAPPAGQLAPPAAQLSPPAAQLAPPAAQLAPPAAQLAPPAAQLAPPRPRRLPASSAPVMTPPAAQVSAMSGTPHASPNSSANQVPHPRSATHNPPPTPPAVAATPSHVADYGSRAKRAAVPEQRPADTAPHSAIPNSAVPYSLIPNSAIPHSPMGWSRGAQAAHSQQPDPPARPAYRGDDTGYGQGAMTAAFAVPTPGRPMYPDYLAPVSSAPGYAAPPASYSSRPYSAPPASPQQYASRPPESPPVYSAPPYDAEVHQPVYPASWGAAPVSSSGRPAWDARSGARARFSR